MQTEVLKVIFTAAWVNLCPEKFGEDNTKLRIYKIRGKYAVVYKPIYRRSGN